MKSLWNDQEAQALKGDLLKLRVYTSRLIGQEEDLVLHGGGNTSVKITEPDLFGEEQDILYVKGSGWNLGTIEAPGFAPVRLDVLEKMARLDHLSDPDMVKFQRAAMTNPFAPNPSVEAILHAIIPFTFVDHTHADAVVTITNSPGGEDKIREIYGPNMLIIPYVMPGFILAKEIFERTKDLDWNSLDGMVLLNHGAFTFDHDPKVSYEKMIALVSKAEDFLAAQDAKLGQSDTDGELAPLAIASARKAVSDAWGKPVLARFEGESIRKAFSQLPNVADIATRGPITPDHIIRTKRVPAIIEGDEKAAVDTFVADYTAYYTSHQDGSQTMLDPAPRWAIWKGAGTLVFGPNPKALTILSDITAHTIKAIQQSEKMGGWAPLDLPELFEMEYWSLEQAKLKKGGNAPAKQGQVALVTGAASGIGKACVDRLLKEGAVVMALDINPRVETVFNRPEVLGLTVDVMDEAAMAAAIAQGVKYFGGLDLVVSNAGNFPKSQSLGEIDAATWQRSLDLNLNSHQRLLKLVIPYLELGFNPAIVLMASKNVPAPGPGAGAYSVAKAGLTQMGRVAAMELGPKGIRVNVLHPNAVYDTGLWTEEVLQARADHYGLTVAEYKANNVLRTEVGSADVAELVTTMLGKAFSKVTGAQVPIDGGNDRVI